MKLIYARDAVWTPWKNGGGVTRQIAVFPATAGFDDFDWRISTARIDSAGAFSHFAGIDRTLAVTGGILDFCQSGQAPVRLTAESPAVSFAGDAPIEAQPVGGAVTDFNVMTRRGRFTHAVSRRLLGGEEQLTLTGGRGQWVVAYVADGQCRVDGRDQSSGLRNGDAEVVGESQGSVTLRSSGDAVLILADIRGIG